MRLSTALRERDALSKYMQTIPQVMPGEQEHDRWQWLNWFIKQKHKYKTPRHEKDDQ